MARHGFPVGPRSKVAGLASLAALAVVGAWSLLSGGGSRGRGTASEVATGPASPGPAGPVATIPVAPIPESPIPVSPADGARAEGPPADVAPARVVPVSLPVDELDRGRELFAREWLPDDPRCHGGDGLGPVFNAGSCLACHNLGGPGGAGPIERNIDLIIAKVGLVPTRSMGLLYGGGTSTIEQARGALAGLHRGFRDASTFVLHHSGTDPGYDAWRLGFLGYDPSRKAGDGMEDWSSGDWSRFQIDTIFSVPIRGVLPPEIPRPEVGWVNQASGYAAQLNELADRSAPATLVLARRNAPPLFGLGRIDALPAGSIEAGAARHDPEFPGVRGRVHRMADGRVGRFGWKAQVASLEEFTLTACANELGLEVPGHPQAASPIGPAGPPKGPDMTAQECDALVAYLRSLPTPVAIGSSEAFEGGRLFRSVGCATCHTPDLGGIEGIYSDLLLHDMGQSLGDGGVYYGGPATADGPTSLEWRTPPLWGFRDSAPYLHDGRARTLEEAVAQHGGEAYRSTDRFFKLHPSERDRVRAFLMTLAAPTEAKPPPGPTATAPGRAETRHPWAEAQYRWADARSRVFAELMPLVRLAMAKDDARRAGRVKSEAEPHASEVEKVRRVHHQAGHHQAGHHRAKGHPGTPSATRPPDEPEEGRPSPAGLLTPTDPSATPEEAEDRRWVTEGLWLLVETERLAEVPQSNRKRARDHEAEVTVASIRSISEPKANVVGPKLHAARSLEKMGKANGALLFYKEIVRIDPDSAEGREAAGRIAALEGRGAEARPHRPTSPGRP